MNRALRQIPAFAVVAAVVALAWIVTAPAPGLTGYGCEGFDRPIQGFEESDFPICRAIVRNR